MDKKELREGLKRLEAHLEQYDLTSVFLEESEQTLLDSLVLGLRVSDELSLDVSCNFVDAPDYGSILQFYGQLELDGIMAESPGIFTELVILQMINLLNVMLPVGQLLYMHDGKEPMHSIGLRYTMRTELASEDELEKCADVVEMLMDDYELLCSVLMLVAEGETVQGAMETVIRLMKES